jgi:uncharacterized protein YtpQ (UPF0354 family)
MAKRAIVAFLASLLAYGSATFPACGADDSGSRQFTARVLGICKTSFPKQKFVESGPLLIQTGKRQISLDNLYRSAGPDRSLSDDAIRAFIDSTLKDGALPKTVSFQKAEPLLRPQLTPKDYLVTAKDALVYEPSGLTDDLLISYVLDEPDRFLYVRPTDLEKWHVPVNTVREASQKNLAAAHDAMSIEPGINDGKVSYLLIEAKDGYAAARMTLPLIQEMISKMLGGGAFEFGIPNRNFVVAWRTDYVKKDQFKSQVRKDFANRPHPLSPLAFRCENGKIVRAP